MSCRSLCIPTTSPSTSAPTFSRTMLPFHDSATCSLWIRLAGPRMLVVHRVSLVDVHCCPPRPRLSSNPQPSSPSFPPRPLALRLIGRSVGSSGRGPSLPAVSTRSPDVLIWSVEPPSLCGRSGNASPGLQVGPCLVPTPYALAPSSLAAGRVRLHFRLQPGKPQESGFGEPEKGRSDLSLHSRIDCLIIGFRSKSKALSMYHA